jgi:hypothetical protein
MANKVFCTSFALLEARQVVNNVLALWQGINTVLHLFRHTMIMLLHYVPQNTMYAFAPTSLPPSSSLPSSLSSKRANVHKGGCGELTENMGVWRKQRGVVKTMVGVARIWGGWRDSVICIALFRRALHNVLMSLVTLNDKQWS